MILSSSSLNLLRRRGISYNVFVGRSWTFRSWIDRSKTSYGRVTFVEGEGRNTFCTIVGDSSKNNDDYAEWEMRKDKKTGRSFYFHPDTKQTTWHHPSIGLKPATFSRRLAAGALDVFISMGWGTALGGFLAWELEGLLYGQLGIMFGMLTGFTFRDSIFENGTRSLGKRIMSIEIVHRKDGMLPSRLRTMGRNSYMPIFEAHQPLFPLIHLIFLSDLFMVKFDKQGRRYGDFLAGTTVVPEMPLIAQRIQEQQEQNRLAQLKEETGSEFIWKRGKLRIWDDAVDTTQTELFQPPAFYSIDRPFKRKAKE